MSSNYAELGELYPAHIEAIKARHDHALEIAGAGHVIIFSGAPKLVFLDDSCYPFKANPHFVGWLPLTATPFCYLIHTPGEVPILVYYQEKDYWHTPPADPQGYWTDHFDIRVVHTVDDVARHLPQTRDKCILIGDIGDETHAFNIERINPASAINILHYARSEKTGYELACMRAASRRAVKGHRAAEEAFRAGKSEYEIHLAYCRAVKHTENELPYANIIALNENSAIMHYQHQARESPAKTRSFLIDAGANVHGYASDITRSYSFEDRVTVGLASGSIESLIENGVTTAFFPTGLGHLLGIQVHDVGGFMEDESGNTIDRPSGHRWLRLTRTLEVDQVLTIEPGCYVIGMLLENLEGTPGAAMVNRDKVEWLRPFGGARIEDNVRVLADGCENFTRAAFAEP
jgi:Xaa-Pro dipeptidase